VEQGGSTWKKSPREKKGGEKKARGPEPGGWKLRKKGKKGKGKKLEKKYPLRNKKPSAKSERHSKAMSTPNRGNKTLHGGYCPAKKRPGRKLAGRRNSLFLCFTGGGGEAKRCHALANGSGRGGNPRKGEIAARGSFGKKRCEGPVRRRPADHTGMGTEKKPPKNRVKLGRAEIGG